MFIAVEENIRIEFDRFYSAVKFHNMELPEGLRDLLETLEANVINEYDNQAMEIQEESWDEGYAEGRDVGYEEGHEDGKEVGYDEGYSEGLEQGHEDGHKISYEEGFTAGYEQAQNDRA